MVMEMATEEAEREGAAMEEAAMEEEEGYYKKRDLLGTLSIPHRPNTMIRNIGTRYQQGWIQWIEELPWLQ